MRKKGVTLVELILVVVVMAVIMAALAPYIGAIQRVWQWGDRRTEMMQHGRVSLDRMVRTLRNCASFVAIDGTTGQGTFIEFTNPDGDQIAYFHNVTDNTAYYDATLGDNNLGMRTISAGVTTTSLLAEAVQSITFSYYKHEMDTSTPPVAIRTPATTAGEVGAVDIELEMSDPEGEITSTLPLTSFVFCRIVSPRSGAGDVWLILPNSGEIVKINSNGDELLRKDGFNSPGAVAVDPNDGSCWVTDADGVMKLDSSGNELLRRGGFHHPISVSVDPNDGSCWAGDFTILQDSGVVKFDSNGNELVRKYGSLYGFSDSLRDVSVDSKDGSCWAVTDDTVVKFDSDGNELLRMSSRGDDGRRENDNLYKIKAVSADPNDGSCWVAIERFSQVVKIDSSGNQIIKKEDFAEHGPYDVSVDPNDGSCWVADTYNNRLVKFDSDGNMLLEKTSARFQVLAVDPTDSSCWASTGGLAGNKRLIKVSSDGDTLVEKINLHFNGRGVAVDTGERQ